MKLVEAFSSRGKYLCIVLLPLLLSLISSLNNTDKRFVERILNGKMMKVYCKRELLIDTVR